MYCILLVLYRTQMRGLVLGRKCQNKNWYAILRMHPLWYTVHTLNNLTIMYFASHKAHPIWATELYNKYNLYIPYESSSSLLPVFKSDENGIFKLCRVRVEGGRGGVQLHTKFGFFYFLSYVTLITAIFHQYNILHEQSFPMHHVLPWTAKIWWSCSRFEDFLVL